MQQRGFHLRFSHGKPKIYQSAKEQMKPSWPREIFLLTGFQAQVLSYGSPLLSGYWSPGGMSVTLRGQRSSCFTPGWAKPTKWQVFQVTNYDPPGRQSQPWMYKVAHWDTRGVIILTICHLQPQSEAFRNVREEAVDLCHRLFLTGTIYLLRYRHIETICIQFSLDACEECWSGSSEVKIYINIATGNMVGCVFSKKHIGPYISNRATDV